MGFGYRMRRRRLEREREPTHSIELQLSPLPAPSSSPVDRFSCKGREGAGRGDGGGGGGEIVKVGIRSGLRSAEARELLPLLLPLYHVRAKGAGISTRLEYKSLHSDLISFSITLLATLGALHEHSMHLVSLSSYQLVSSSKLSNTHHCSHMITLSSDPSLYLPCYVPSSTLSLCVHHSNFHKFHSSPHPQVGSPPALPLSVFLGVQ